jgi:hypothetical protein
MSGAARALLAPLALLLAAAPVVAQDARLQARLDKPTMVAVNAIVDSARLAKIPTAPLVDKALEGAAKGSDGPKIVAAVQQLSVRMGAAKRALGPAASPDEIKAAAGAIAAGVTARDLARLRSATTRKRPLTMPLAVLSDLIGQAVPIAAATNLVVQLAKSGVKDPELALFQRNVRADIDHGADPAVAATTRARGLVLRSSGAPPKAAEQQE